jgi:hypothetical protein
MATIRNRDHAAVMYAHLSTTVTPSEPPVSGGPRLIVDQPDFRIVQVGDGAGLRYVLEVSDGADALGVERWREFKLDNQKLRSLFGYLCRLATKETSDEPQ